MGLVQFTYTNYRGETAVRRVRPLAIWRGKNEWHPDMQWLLLAWDEEKQAHRDFAMKDISEWKELSS